MKTLLITLALASTLFAHGEWIRMLNTGKNVINYQYTRCYYKPSFGNNLNISIIVKKSYCPYSIKYNPISNEWR